MRRLPSTAALAIVALLTMVRDVPATDRADGADDDRCNVLILSEDGPAVVQLTMHIDGKPLRQILQEYVDELFARFDADKNGVLNQKERDAFRAITDILSGATHSPSLDLWELPPDPGDWEKVQFTEYVVANLGRSIVVQTRNPNRETIVETANQAVFSALDADRDKKLSRQELASPNRILRRDWDEDNSVALIEIVTQGPTVRARPTTQKTTTPAAAVPTVHVLDGTQSLAALVRLLISKYDRPTENQGKPATPSDFMLNAAELCVPPETIRDFDQDQNGSLDLLELRRYCENPVAMWRVEIRVGPESSLKFVAGPDTDRQGDITVSRFRRNLLVLGPAVQSWPQDVDSFVRSQFVQMDLDKNEYLERRETAVLSKQLPFSVFDRDDDMRVYLAEFSQVFKEQMAVARSRIMVNLHGSQHGLFETIDANSDQRISSAEISRLTQLVPAMDSDQDGAISESELPNTWTLTLESPLTMTSVPVDNSPSPNSATRRATNPVLLSGLPRWFQYMDRNRDLTLTRREFLGPIADFEKFDTNSDGSLSSEEVVGAK